ncbi:hypothetical protein ACI3P4_07490 [Glaesserella parasuis]|uniref:hypothetical protein n=1 Tax=Glaesserella parasuis TaxID=738 RepID=UPI002774C451|nr:hypothetical protein [Glaesserella parasuis]
MEITLGDKIKINGEEVPGYLLKALYENLKSRYKSGFIVAENIQAQGTKVSSLPPLNSQYEVECSKLAVNSLKVRPDLIRYP